MTLAFKMYFRSLIICVYWASPGGSEVKNPPASAGDTGSTVGSEKFPGEENGKPPQNCCLGNSMDIVAW